MHILSVQHYCDLGIKLSLIDINIKKHNMYVPVRTATLLAGIPGFGSPPVLEDFCPVREWLAMFWSLNTTVNKSLVNF